jgi:hypothetical protein
VAFFKTARKTNIKEGREEDMSGRKEGRKEGTYD